MRSTLPRRQTPRLFRVPGIPPPVSPPRPADSWAALRGVVGARPAGMLAFPTRRSRLDDLRPGETLLLLRKYGGLGDVLISSMLFPMLVDQYPHVRVTYAVPRRYHPLFAGTGLALLPYEEVFHGETHYHRGTVRPALLEQYDLIEDISIPCHIWETIFGRYGGMTVADGNGLRWRNRLDMWARWFGLTVRDPRTNIRFTEAELAEASKRITAVLGRTRPTCLLAPFSGNRTKSYPWFERLHTRLQADGWAVALLYKEPVASGLPILEGLSYRQMGAACAVADLIVSVDTAAFHWGGILGRPTLGVFNVNDGATYARYYPTASIVQTCDTPCLNTRYRQCAKHVTQPMESFRHRGLAVSRCYQPETVDTIADAARRYVPGHTERDA